MTCKVEPSEKALTVCAKFYGSAQKNGCHRCPIHKECTAPIAQWSQEGLDNHNARVNAAADLIELEQ